jgi:hypothetical protein
MNGGLRLRLGDVERQVERFLERPDALGTDARHGQPFIPVRGENSGDASEVRKKCASRGGRDSGHGREQCFRSGSSGLGLWPLCVRGTIRCGLDALAADRETMNSAGRVALMIATEKSDALVDHRQARAAYGVRVERATVDVCAFEQQVRKRAGGSQLAELRPETSLKHSPVKIEDAFPLNEGVRPDGVVARRE